ncbi:hypothetical protein B0T26DRAFT_715239 [Lasiosphaeria miniovina]|uniref:F-box domain-containing protein n=1 Tax=Lasiosphaeria miniovina TaxID=1954250 RepID=A0AA40DUZ0_9PEZI|nr:uncharacterized protein B0T26DRAFT_715239 [Lasiosphaeria miniovina]KAK0712773.1 hypothetical protein B0T26DRAFT_715239 [Lasiosphaeria miniovina]
MPQIELMSLPPELLLQVFGPVGAKSFRQDLGRLTVSRHWYSYAWPVLVGDIRLTAASLLQFTTDETGLHCMGGRSERRCYWMIFHNASMGENIGHGREGSTKYIPLHSSCNFSSWN